MSLLVYSCAIEKKASKSWYSHSLRTFQLTSVVHIYATTSELWNVFKGRGTPVLDSRIVASCDTGAPENPHRFNSLEDYAELTKKRIPKHKLLRFEELVKRFREAKPHSKETRNGVSFVSLGLVDWAFRAGGVFLHYVVLLRRRPDAALPGNASDFEVIGYLVYTR